VYVNGECLTCVGLSANAEMRYEIADLRTRLSAAEQARDGLRGALADVTAERDAARKAFADIGWPDPAGRIDYLETNGEEAMATVTRLTEERDTARVEREEARALAHELVSIAEGMTMTWPALRKTTERTTLETLARFRAILSRPATVATAMAREALAALEYHRARQATVASCDLSEADINRETVARDALYAATTARLAAEKEAADAAK